jgi:hypothetical protein
MNCAAFAQRVSPGLATAVIAIQQRLPSIIMTLGSLEWTLVVIVGMVLQAATKSSAVKS